MLKENSVSDVSRYTTILITATN